MVVHQNYYYSITLNERYYRNKSIVILPTVFQQNNTPTENQQLI
jgi:hypothetical protein